MVCFKRTAVALTVTLILLLAVSAAVYASDAPDKVYFERSDGKIIVVDYEEALRLRAEEGKHALYDATVQGIRDALKDFRDVWVEVEINGDPRVLYYSEAVKDGRTYSQMVNNPNAYIVSAPQPDWEMYLDGVASVKLRATAPLDFPAWLEDWNISWQEQWDITVIDVFIDANELPLDWYELKDIEEVMVLGTRAKEDPAEKGRWRVTFEEEITEDLQPGDVVIRINGKTYN